MHNYPLVSVVIPAFNHQNYVLLCLESIKAQTYKNIELLICDDGSTDNSAAIIESWLATNGYRFTNAIFLQQENSGIVRTIDCLCKRSAGEYIALCASDDYLTVNSIEDRVKEFTANVEMVIGRAKLIDSNGSEISSDAAYSLYGVRYSKFTNCLFDLLFYRWPLVGPVSMYRRNLLMNLNLHFKAEDRQIFIRILRASSIRYIDLPVAAYRYHEGSVTRNSATRNSILRDVAAVNIYYAKLYSGFKRFYLLSFKVDLYILDKCSSIKLGIIMLKTFKAFRYLVGYVAILLA